MVEGSSLSYPLWVRGLKLECLQEGDPIEEVVPFVGTWIEILQQEACNPTMRSYPLWVRGLK